MMVANDTNSTSPLTPEQYFGEYQEVFNTPQGDKLLIDTGFKALPPRNHPLEAKIAQFESRQLGYYAIEYEGYINVFGTGDELLGGLILQRRWNAVLIYSFYLEENLRGIGLGGRIINLAEDLARQMGGTALVLETSTLHTWQFYQKHGFEVVAELNGYIDGQTYFHMFKNIRAENANLSEEDRLGEDEKVDKESANAPV